MRLAVRTATLALAGPAGGALAAVHAESLDLADRRVLLCEQPSKVKLAASGWWCLDYDCTLRAWTWLAGALAVHSCECALYSGVGLNLAASSWSAC